MVGPPRGNTHATVWSRTWNINRHYFYPASKQKVPTLVKARGMTCSFTVLSLVYFGINIDGIYASSIQCSKKHTRYILRAIPAVSFTVEYINKTSRVPVFVAEFGSLSLLPNYTMYYH